MTRERRPARRRASQRCNVTARGALRHLWKHQRVCAAAGATAIIFSREASRSCSTCQYCNAFFSGCCGGYGCCDCCCHFSGGGCGGGCYHFSGGGCGGGCYHFSGYCYCLRQPYLHEVLDLSEDILLRTRLREAAGIFRQSKHQTRTCLRPRRTRMVKKIFLCRTRFFS